MRKTRPPRCAGLKSAIQAYEADPTVENQVRVATWRVLLGEMASEGGEDLSLWSLAIDQIDEGLQALGEVENQLAASPDLNRQISRSPDLAMRLDAARVRQAAIAQREQLARDAERATTQSAACNDRFVPRPAGKDVRGGSLSCA